MMEPAHTPPPPLEMKGVQPAFFENDLQNG